MLSKSFLFLLLCISSIFIPMKSQNYKLVWADEFNYSGKPDASKWNHEIGHIRNLEMQLYTSKKKNSRVKNGILQIKARKKRTKNPYFNKDSTAWKYKDKYGEYTSASINTAKKFEFLYGRVDVRAKLPKGNGVWPAIWMLGANFEEVPWPNAGEIDIMEFVGKCPGQIHGSVHYPDDNHNGYSSKPDTIKVLDASENFHVYSIDWTSEKIDFLVDNKIYHTFNIDDAGDQAKIFRKPYYLIFNLALGGNWPGPVDDEILPQKFLIDYIRVYQKKNKSRPVSRIL